MRVARPKWLNRSNVSILVLAILIVGGILLYRAHHKPTIINNETPTQANERLFKNSQTPDDIRVLVNSYITDKKYDLAVQKAQSLAHSTSATGDYMTELRIATGYTITNKNTFVNDALNALKGKLASMPFYDSYTIGGMLEVAGLKKNAATFYQRAYDAYDPSRADQYTLTKDQLKAKIDELNQ